MIPFLPLKEISLDGVLLAPLMGHAAAAAVLWFVLRFLIGRAGLYRFIWHPPLFNTALYVILLGALVAASA